MVCTPCYYDSSSSVPLTSVGLYWKLEETYIYNLRAILMNDFTNVSKASISTQENTEDVLFWVHKEIAYKILFIIVQTKESWNQLIGFASK